MNYLLLDWGGVISENFFDPYTENTYRMLSRWGELPSLQDYREFMKGFERGYLRGKMTGDQFWTGVMQQFSINPLNERIEALTQEFVDSMKIRPEMFRFLEEIRDDSIIGILSNTYKEMRPIFMQYSNLFDFNVLSCDHKTVKPEQMIFDMAYRKFQRLDPKVRKEDIVFFDDKSKNVEAAREFGFSARKFDLETFKKTSILIRNTKLD